MTLHPLHSSDIRELGDIFGFPGMSKIYIGMPKQRCAVLNVAKFFKKSKKMPIYGLARKQKGSFIDLFWQCKDSVFPELASFGCEGGVG